MAYLLQQLLSESAQKYRDKKAAVFQEHHITYDELEELTNRLANLLIHQGVKRGDRVGIYLNKSLNSITAVCSILKAGAVYVPLDPFAPVKRLAYIVHNCDIKCLITSGDKSENLSRMFPENPPLSSIVLINNDSSSLTGSLSHFSGTSIVDRESVLNFSPDSADQSSLTENDLAYILYTSGSTGEPKGVMITHRNALTFVDWAYETFGIDESDRVSNHAPLHFDLSIFDIFTTLKAGGTLHIIPEWLSNFPVTLAEFIEKKRITVWYSVPSVLTMLVLHGNMERFCFSNLRLVLFAGEVFPVKYLRELMSLVPAAEYYNLYGPTETNVCTYYHVKEIPHEGESKPVSIGKACANFDVFAVNEDGGKIKPGETGELYVRSPSVAKGYWGLKGRTDDAFLPNTLQPYLDDKIYRTGDLVTLQDDGNYTFLGRKDNMIKSRGYRIELGEIETVFYSHPAIKEVAVIALPDEEISSKIVAIVVSHEPESLSKSDLGRFCSEKLPKYMLPEVVEFRESLPKTSTGKIDKKGLEKELI